MNGFGRGKDEQKEKKNKVITRETVGMTFLLFSMLALLIAITGPYLFGDVGMAITAFFLGILGFAVYPGLLLVAYLSLSLVIGKSFIDRKFIVRGSLVALAVFLIVHTATAPFYGVGYGAYLSACWHAAEGGAAGGTGGGVVLGIIVYPVRALLTDVGAYVLFALLTVLAVYFFLLATPLRERISRASRRRGTEPKQAEPAPDVKTQGARPYPGAMQFGDLPEPARAQMPEAYQAPASYPASAPAYPMQAPRAVFDAEAAQKREILFGTDPAANYRSNLIYDKDSYFNTHTRGSNVTSPSPAAKAAPAPTRPSPAISDYAESYAAHAEEERPAFPRKVTEERPRGSDGYSYPVQEDFDANYMQTPSYRAPQSPESSERRDFYAHDVDPEALPAQPDGYDGARRPSEPPAAPASPRFSPEEPPASRIPASRFAPEEPPAAPASPRFSPEEPPAARIPASRFAPEESPAPPVSPRFPGAPSRFGEDRSIAGTDDNAGREASFRSLFSRPVEERTHLGDPLPFTDETPRPSGDRFPGESASSRFSENTANPAGETRDLPDLTEGQAEDAFRAPAEDVPDPESRVFRAPVSNADLFDDDLDDAEDLAEPPADIPSRASRSFGGAAERRAPESAQSFAVAEEKPAPVPEKHIYRAYVQPSLENFSVYDDTVNMSPDEIERNTATIVDTLAGFKVDAEVVKVTIGPAVTRYDIDIPRNITVGTVVKRDKEVALRLHARDGVNMYANTASGTISIEVPNAHRATVGIRSVLQADEYVHAKEGSLMFVIGKDVENKSVCGNIVKMKHLLIAGSTGSGKSVCLNAMLISLICKYSPEDLRLILIDPKKVEFAVFDGLPHLMINEIISDAQKAVTALNWAIGEMERRYRLFEQKTREQHITVRSIDEYNAARTEDEAKLPKIVIVVDELADLMTVARKEIEDRIQRLAQKARAAGLHLVLATQRPSVDVITGVIKGNLPTRIAFRVIQEVDSRTILDETGAEKLLGNGDMLFRTEGMFNCLRVQGAFLSSGEVQAIIDDIKANNEAYFDESVASYINNPGTSGVENSGDAEDGAASQQYIRALGIVVKLGQASISLIQRKCSVGYNHAGKIIEWMEAMGYISPFDGKAKARDVLLTQEQFEAKYGSID